MTYPPPPGSGDYVPPSSDPAQPPSYPPPPSYEPPTAYEPPSPYQAPGYGAPAYPQPPDPAYPQAADPAYPQAPDQGYPNPAYQQGYATPYGYSPYPVKPAPDGLSIAALVVSCVAVLGLCGYGIGGLLGVVGAVLGHVSRRRIRETGAGGDGMALAGIIVGWIAAGIALVVIAILVVAIVASSNNT